MNIPISVFFPNGAQCDRSEALARETRQQAQTVWDVIRRGAETKPEPKK